MEFALSTPQILAAGILAAAVAVLVCWLDRRFVRKHVDKVTVRLMGAAVAAEPGDVLTIAFGGTVSDEEYEHIKQVAQPLIDMGIKVGIIENSTGVAVARGRRDA